VRGPLRELARRLRAAAMRFLLVLLAALGVSLVVTPLGFLWLVVVPIAFAFAFAALFTSGHRAEPPTPSPDEPPLLARTDEPFPQIALPTVREIATRLEALQPHLGALPASSALAGEAGRLVGQAIPEVIGAYFALPADARSTSSHYGRQLNDSLTTCLVELTSLHERIARDRHDNFEIHRRFIETRYGDDGLRRE
jgi:hypothetical protein